MEHNKNSESGKDPRDEYEGLTPEQAEARRRQGITGPPRRTGTGLFYNNGDEMPPTHPDHGPMHLIPRQQDGTFATYYYCSREELGDFDIASPPPRRHRRDGFSAERQQEFVEHYRNTGSLTDAARLTGISRATVYNLLNSPDAEAFRTAIQEAGRGVDVILEATAIERAVHGQEEIVYFQGRRVGVRWKYDNRLLMSLLRARNPLKYAPLSEIEGWLRRRGLEPPVDVEGALDRLAAAEAEWGRRLPGEDDRAALPTIAPAPALEAPAPEPASDPLRASISSISAGEPPVQASNSSTSEGEPPPQASNSSTSGRRGAFAIPSSRRRPGSQAGKSRQVPMIDRC